MKKKVNKTIQGVSLKGLHLVILYNKNARTIIFDTKLQITHIVSGRVKIVSVYRSTTP